MKKTLNLIEKKYIYRPLADKKTEAMAVKITDILDPKTFWAHETENSGRQEKMKGIQKELQLQWLNSLEIEKMDATEGLRVIVLINKELFRGEIIGVRYYLVRLFHTSFLT